MSKYTLPEENDIANEAHALAFAIADMAHSIFAECGREDDFCIQYAEGLVFGGWNRITLTSQGWYAHKESCTPEFYAKFQEKFGKQS
jgi:hypothetical protein